jgi:hypothetical protein
MTQAKKVRWAAEEVIGNYRVYARPSRGEIIVRIEIDGDTTKYAEWSMPKLLGLSPAMHQAAIQTQPEDIRV